MPYIYPGKTKSTHRRQMAANIYNFKSLYRQQFYTSNQELLSVLNIITDRSDFPWLGPYIAVVRMCKQSGTKPNLVAKICGYQIWFCTRLVSVGTVNGCNTYHICILHDIWFFYRYSVNHIWFPRDVEIRQPSFYPLVCEKAQTNYIKSCRIDVGRTPVYNLVGNLYKNTAIFFRLQCVR